MKLYKKGKEWITSLNVPLCSLCTLCLRVIYFGLFFIGISLFAQEEAENQAPVNPRDSVETRQFNTVRFGTETEIAALIQTLRNDGSDHLDDEIISLAANTRNRNILGGAFAFFTEREKVGLEDRAIRAIEEWDEEESETVIAAINYLGRVKTADAAPVLRELLEVEERRFMNAAFRALGRVSGGENSGEVAEFLVDFYENRDPGDEYRRDMIFAMGMTGSSVAVPFLVDLATNADTRPALRIAALEAIAEIGDPDGLDAVLVCISVREPLIRAAAVAALGPFSGPVVDEAILDAFRDSDHRTRIAAAQASRQRQLVAAVPYLQFRAERDDVPAVREEALRSLGAIADSESISILEGFFSDRRASDRIRIVAGEMLMQNQSERFLDVFIRELDEAKLRNQTALYNNFLRIIGGTKSGNMEGITRRLMQDSGIVERSFALEMAANNNLVSLADEIRILADDRNESLARRARRTMEQLGISN